MVLLEGFCPAGALYFVLTVPIKDMVVMDPANMVLAKALLLFGLGYAAVAKCVRKKRWFMSYQYPPVHSRRLPVLKGNMGRTRSLNVCPCWFAEP